MKILIFLALIIMSNTSLSKSLFIGDSLTYSLASSFSKIEPVDAKFLESTGLKSDNILSWTDYIETMDLSNYDRIYIVLGINDMINENDETYYQDRVNIFITSLLNQNRNIIWLLPPVLKNVKHESMLLYTRTIIKAACIEHSVDFFDMRDVLGYNFMQTVNDRNIRTDDGIHITPYGADRVITNLLLR